jgi:glycerol-3-phosphate cytidylyltransferase
MKTVITYGTFDLFHIGHINLLKRLRHLGDRLVVGCSTDEFNHVKGKKTIMPFDHRAEILSSIRYVDKVIQETCWEQKRDDIRQENASIFAMGDDWVGRFDDLNDICQVVYLPRTQDVSTTEIRQLVHAMYAEQIGELKNTVFHLNQIVQHL